MIKDTNEEVFREIQGTIDNEILSLLRAFSYKISFIRNPQGKINNLLILKGTRAKDNILAGDVLFTNFKPEEGKSTLETFLEMKEEKKQELKSDIFNRLRTFLEEEDQILYVLIKQKTMFDTTSEDDPFDFANMIREMYKSPEIGRVDQLTMLLRFTPTYEKNSLGSIEQAAVANDTIREHLSKTLDYKKACEIKELLVSNKPTDYSQEVSNKVLALIVNDVIVQKELKNALSST